MPTTRAARRAARCLTEVLPADALGLVLYQLPLAHDIAAVAPTCHVLCDAAKLARKLRPFSAEVVTLEQEHRVGSVAATPNGDILTGCQHTIKVWRDGACVRTIRAHGENLEDNDVSALAVLPGGSRFFSVSCDSETARLWALDGTLERGFRGFGADAVAVTSDGMHLVLPTTPREDSRRDEIRLYRLDGTLVHTFEGHEHYVEALTVTRDGQHIISGGLDDLIKVWSVATKSLVSTCAGHTNGVDALAAMPDSQRFLSAGYLPATADNTVRVWLLDGTLENTFELHRFSVNALVALPDNQHALSGSYDNAKLFNVNDGAVLRTFTYQNRGVYSLALLPDGLRFVSGSYDATARIAYHGLAPQRG